MSFQQNLNQKISRNKIFEHQSIILTPTLYKNIKKPKSIVEVIQNSKKIHGWDTFTKDIYENISDISLGKNDELILDFNEHLVGYITLRVESIGSPPDAPAYIKFTFGEMPIEVAEDTSNYNGWVSRSWLQEEYIHIDELPNTIKLSRRYSFRYCKVEVIDTSPKYKLKIKDVSVETVTSANKKDLIEYETGDRVLKEIDDVSIATLKDCMQEVFEDGPKRDRRLWLGDLRLQAQANYKTFNNNNLVKRNLYQFAAVPNQDGQVAANLFVKPQLIPDDTYLFDYSLFFTTTLYDYYQHTKDIKTLHELWPTALKQIEIALERLDDNLILEDDNNWWSFVDWNDDLNKQTPSQAILIYAIKNTIKIANVLEKYDAEKKLNNTLEKILKSTIRYLWDEETNYFISGISNQISWASQVWMVLAEVFENEINKDLLIRLIEDNPKIEMNTPYMHHHLVEALFKVGLKEEAIDWIKMYWGGMVLDGADTFWESYNPKNKNFSPYGDPVINSYCHAWSCSPTYLLRTYVK